MLRRKIKNCILKTVTWIMGFTFLLAASAIDSPSWIPTVLCIISAGYLLLFDLANCEIAYQESEEGEL